MTAMWRAAPLRDTWSALPAGHQPGWPGGPPRAVVRELASRPPLVRPEECEALRRRLAAVARGEAFMIQGGDCAETFAASATPRDVRGKVATLRRMAAIVTEAAGIPVVTVGRMAGQYAKPRSSPAEHRDGRSLPAYLGDAVNGLEFAAAARTPDPGRLLRAYEASAATLRALRAQLGGHPALFTSHEGLLLDYEAALTRTDPASGYPYATSGHLLWIGERTRDPAGAHVEFFSQIRNPIAVKLGPAAAPGDVGRLVDRLDPQREPGRLTFIARLGASRVRDLLPELLAAAAAAGSRSGWICDPMHGNTIKAPSGHKTRRMADILDEVRGFFEVHAALGAHPGGVHVELTGEDVTECVGGAGPGGVGYDDLGRRYSSACDPRLNRSQALEFARELAGLAARARRPDGDWRVPDPVGA